jgi:small nuclear ribonucleoprotein (snRNP)-like protein
MVNGIERPLDLLNQSKGKEILVQLKNNQQLVGTLIAFDIHINIVLSNTKELDNGEIKRNIGMTFIRGDTIIYISPSQASA